MSGSPSRSIMLDTRKGRKLGVMGRDEKARQHTACSPSALQQRDGAWGSSGLPELQIPFTLSEQNAWEATMGIAESLLSRVAEDRPRTRASAWPPAPFSSKEGALGSSVGTSQNTTSESYQVTSFPYPEGQPKASFCRKADPGANLPPAPSQTRRAQLILSGNIVYPTRFREQFKAPQLCAPTPAANPNHRAHPALDSHSTCVLCQRSGWPGKREGRKS